MTDFFSFYRVKQTKPSPDWKGGVAVAPAMEREGTRGTLQSGINSRADRTRSAGHSKKKKRLQTINRANFEFYICSRKIGSQRFLPRKKASALPLRARRTHLLRRVCRIFFGSKIASANFSAALRKLEIEPYKFIERKVKIFF